MIESGRIAEVKRQIKAKVKDKAYKVYQSHQGHQDNQDQSQDGPSPYCCTPPGGGGAGADTKP